MAAEQEFLAFVREHVRSVWALEMLLLLRRDSGRCWAPAELVGELRASQTLVNDNLERFERSGLVVRGEHGATRYAPASPVLDALCAELEAAYRQRPVATINMIARPGDPLQSLADAFKFRSSDK